MSGPQKGVREGPASPISFFGTFWTHVYDPGKIKQFLFLFFPKRNFPVENVGGVVKNPLGKGVRKVKYNNIAV